MIKINEKTHFSYNKRPLIIAEISANHNGNKNRFLKLIDSAFKNGADLVKIQTYEPEDITIKEVAQSFKTKEKIWKKKNLWEIYKKACTPFDWHHDAFKIANKHKKVLFSSPFSKRAVDFLEKLKVKLYKIASFEITDLNLIKYVASKKKPIILSTGMATLKEIDRAIRIINQYHKKIIILHCVSNYPTELKNTNLSNIIKLKKIYNKYLVGVSDHTDNIYSSIASLPLGIVAVEKHYNLDDLKTPDSKFSINSKMLAELKRVFLSLDYSFNNKNKIFKNKKNIKLRRSIYAIKNIRKNEKFTLSNIQTFRPFSGVPAENYFELMGKKAKRNILKNRSIKLKDIN